MNMIEKMARAMGDGKWDARSFLETPNGETPEEYREYWIGKSVQALQSMLEPSEGMVEAGNDWVITEDSRKVFTAMIRAALEEN